MKHFAIFLISLSLMFGLVAQAQEAPLDWIDPSPLLEDSQPSKYNKYNYPEDSNTFLPLDSIDHYLWENNMETSGVLEDCGVVINPKHDAEIMVCLELAISLGGDEAAMNAYFRCMAGVIEDPAYDECAIIDWRVGSPPPELYEDEFLDEMLTAGEEDPTFDREALLGDSSILELDFTAGGDGIDELRILPVNEHGLSSDMEDLLNLDFGIKGMTANIDVMKLERAMGDVDMPDVFDSFFENTLTIKAGSTMKLELSGPMAGSSADVDIGESAEEAFLNSIEFDENRFIIWEPGTDIMITREGGIGFGEIIIGAGETTTIRIVVDPESDGGGVRVETGNVIVESGKTDYIVAYDAEKGQTYVELYEGVVTVTDRATGEATKLENDYSDPASSVLIGGDSQEGFGRWVVYGVIALIGIVLGGYLIKKRKFN